ncbi:MAG: hypothetical protein R6U98_14940 [Pirellulaceae bacterium]
MEKHLRQIDPSVIENNVPDPDGCFRRVTKHVTAKKVREIMGNEAEEFLFIAFVRDPAEMIASKYFFYKRGWPRERLNDGKIGFFKGKKRLIGRNLAARVWLARLLPLPLWGLLYPAKSNSYFLCDDGGRFLINRVGNFSSLQEDFIDIFSRVGYDPGALILPYENAAKYQTDEVPLGFFKIIARRRFRRDIEFMKDVQGGDFEAHIY